MRRWKPSQNANGRWFQFSLRTLMVAVTLLAVPLGYVGWQAKIVRERKTALERLYSLGGVCMTVEQYRMEIAAGMRHGLTEDRVPSVSWPRAWLGGEAIIGMYIPAEVSTGRPDDCRSVSRGDRQPGSYQVRNRSAAIEDLAGCTRLSPTTRNSIRLACNSSPIILEGIRGSEERTKER